MSHPGALTGTRVADGRWMVCLTAGPSGSPCVSSYSLHGFWPLPPPAWCGEGSQASVGCRGSQPKRPLPLPADLSLLPCSGGLGHQSRQAADELLPHMRLGSCSLPHPCPAVVIHVCRAAREAGTCPPRLFLPSLGPQSCSLAPSHCLGSRAAARTGGGGAGAQSLLDSHPSTH